MSKTIKKQRADKTGAGRGKKKAKSKTALGAERIGLRRELLGLVFLALALLLLLALFTYSPADATAKNAVQNLAGRLGAGLASALLGSFGLSSYLLALAIGGFGVLLGLRRSLAIKLKETLGMVLGVVFGGVLCELLLGALWDPAHAYTPGGQLGHWLCSNGSVQLGAWGLGILAGLGFILALVLATDLPPLRSAAFMGRGVWWGLKGGGLAVAGIGRFLAERWHRESELPPRSLPERKENGKADKAALPKASKEKTKLLTATPTPAPAVPEAANAEPTPGTEKPLPEIVHPGSEMNEDEEPVADDDAPFAAPPAWLDRGEKEVTIKSGKASETKETGAKRAARETSLAAEFAAAEPTPTRAEEPQGDGTIGEDLTPGGEPQIVDSRPPRPDEDEISDEAFELEEDDSQEEYALPPLSLLDYTNEARTEIDKELLYNNARLLERTLLDYRIECQVKEIHPGPVITMYEVAPARGTKISRISNLEDDLAMALAALKVRIVAPIPGKSVVGIEVPSVHRETVYLKEIIGHKTFGDSKSRLTIALGKDIFGYPVVADLQKMPHLLIAGATGAGKSVGVNGMILSILFRNTPDDVKFILIDPKRLEFNFYEGIPHLLLPVVTDPKQAALALAWATHEMDNRYKLLSEWGVKNIDSYNRLVKRIEEVRERRGNDIAQVIEEFSAEIGDGRTLATKLKTSPMPKRLPFLVVVIDELADLMMVAGKEVETSIARLAQLARASGIHLIVATQRPSTDVLTGLIKNNFPARLSFRVSQKVDSRTILDRNGAEALLGRGDMLYLPGSGELTRIHGAYVSEEETWRVVEFIKKQRKPSYQNDILERIEEKAAEEEAVASEYDSEYDKAVQIVCETGKASISMLQRRLRVGYNRAARMIEKMEEEGLVGGSDGVKGRPVYGRPIPRD